MTTFNDQDVFGSGPVKTAPGPIELRAANQDATNGIGAALLNQGTRARTIEQRGRLAADDPAALYALMDAVEDMIDGYAHTLEDEHGRAWPHCVMTRFSPGPVTRYGPRVGVDYEIYYTQVLP